MREYLAISYLRPYNMIFISPLTFGMHHEIPCPIPRRAPSVRVWHHFLLCYYLYLKINNYYNQEYTITFIMYHHYVNIGIIRVQTQRYQQNHNRRETKGKKEERMKRRKRRGKQKIEISKQESRFI